MGEAAQADYSSDCECSHGVMRPEGQRTVQWPYICARAHKGPNRASAVHRINAVQEHRVIPFSAGSPIVASHYNATYIAI
jgi:hypothetical protein